MTDEQRVKERYPDAVASWTSRGWRILFNESPVMGVQIIGKTESAHVPESEAWADAASRLPKAEEIKAKGIAADREREADANAGNYWYPTERMNSPDTWDRPDLDYPNPVKEPAPQAFEEWHSRAPIHSADSREIEQARFHRQLAWNAAKASSPATVPRDIAHTLWNEGGRLRTELAASLGVHPENWHKEGLQQRIAEWDKAAERYFDYAFSGTVSSPAVAGGESETAYVEAFNDGVEAAAVAFEYMWQDWIGAAAVIRKEKKPRIKDVRGNNG